MYMPDVVSPTSGASYQDIAYDIGIALHGESVAAVPEPAAWALMIGGFSLAGAALRRRRAVTA